MADSYSIENSHAGKEFGAQSTPMDVKKQRRKKDRERYAHMTNEEKQEKLKRRREAYHEIKQLKNQTGCKKKAHKEGRNMQI